MLHANSRWNSSVHDLSWLYDVSISRPFGSLRLEGVLLDLARKVVENFARIELFAEFLCLDLAACRERNRDRAASAASIAVALPSGTRRRGRGCRRKLGLLVLFAVFIIGHLAIPCLVHAMGNPASHTRRSQARQEAVAAQRDGDC